MLGSYSCKVKGATNPSVSYREAITESYEQELKAELLYYY